MSKDPLASFVSALPLWGTLGLAFLGVTGVEGVRLLPVAEAEQVSMSELKVADAQEPPASIAASSEKAPSEKMSAAEADRKLQAMFDATDDHGARPSQPGLAKLGVSEAHLKAVWFDAARAGKTDLLVGLVKRGFDPNAQDAKGYTAVILATYNDHLGTVEALVEAGAKPCGRDKKGNTALMGAAFKGEPAIVRYLASRGCPVDTQNKVGQTALMMAALFGRDGAAQALLDLGANPSLKDSSGATALGLAEAQDNAPMVKLLEHYKKPAR